MAGAALTSRRVSFPEWRHTTRPAARRRSVDDDHADVRVDGGNAAVIRHPGDVPAADRSRRIAGGPIIDRLTTAQTFVNSQALKAGNLFWQVDATAASARPGRLV